jgi:hypothetical protein
MIANRRCCRPGELGLLHASRIIKLSMSYRMTTLTDREISPVGLFPKYIPYARCITDT